MYSVRAMMPSTGMALYMEALMPPTSLWPFRLTSPAASAPSMNSASRASLPVLNVTFIWERNSVSAQGKTIRTGPAAFDAMTAWLLDDSQWDSKDLHDQEVFLKPCGVLLLQHYRDHLRLYLERLSAQCPGLVHPGIVPAINRMGEMVSGKERSDWLLGKAVDRRLKKFSNIRERELREKVAACVAQLKEIDREIIGCLLGIK